jgi:hypothetical protein
VIFFIAVKIFFVTLYYFAKTVCDMGNGGHFWSQLPRKHKVYQKYSMQLKKKLFLQTCVISSNCPLPVAHGRQRSCLTLGNRSNL